MVSDAEDGFRGVLGRLRRRRKTWAPAAGPRVLVVDDERATRDVLCDLLTEMGFRATPAASGREAVSLLQEGPRPDVILLDLIMPELNGWDFRAWQRQKPEIADIPVVVVSVVEDSSAQRHDLGAVDYLVKPVEFSRLVTALRTCTGLPA